MTNDPRFMCQGCYDKNDLSELDEIEEDEPDHSHFACPSCGATRFIQLP